MPIALRICFDLIALVFLIGIAFAIQHYRACRVIADDHGIRWHGTWKGWRSATWNEVNDYYHPALSTGGVSSRCYIVTAHGTVMTPLDLTAKTNNTAFQKMVQARATNARVQEWGTHGIRRVDPFPRTFRYWSRGIVTTLFVLIPILFFLYAMAVSWSVHFVQYLYPLIGLSATLPVLIGAIIGLFGAATIPLFAMRSLYLRWKHRGETITVTTEDIRYENTQTNTALHVPWTEVTDYYHAPRSGSYGARNVLVLSGADERQISWDELLSDRFTLLQIVQAYAPRPVHPGDTEGWRTKAAQETVDDSDPTTWQSGAISVGGRVFRYRSKMMALIPFSTAIACTALLAVHVRDMQISDSQDKWFTLIAALIFLIPTLWGFCCVLHSRVETDELGITQYSIFGKKHLYWYTIAEYKNSAGIIKIQGKSGVRIVIWDTIIAYKELKREIERYAPASSPQNDEKILDQS